VWHRLLLAWVLTVRHSTRLTIGMRGNNWDEMPPDSFLVAGFPKIDD